MSVEGIVRPVRITRITAEKTNTVQRVFLFSVISERQLLIQYCTNRTINGEAIITRQKSVARAFSSILMPLIIKSMKKIPMALNEAARIYNVFTGFFRR